MPYNRSLKDALLNLSKRYEMIVYLCLYLPTYLPTCLPSCLPACLPASLSISIYLLFSQNRKEEHELLKECFEELKSVSLKNINRQRQKLSSFNRKYSLFSFFL